MDAEKSEISRFVRSYWEYFLELEEQFKQTKKYVAFDKGNDKTFSIEYLKLIQAICSEIDVVAKEIAQYFDPKFVNIKNPTIKHWGYVITNHMPQIANVRVLLDVDYVVTPWNKFGYMRYFDKKSHIQYRLQDDCETMSWWKDYNKIKHWRTTLDDEGKMNFTLANLKNTVLSFAALYVLETLFMDYITPDVGPDCHIEESRLFVYSMDGKIALGV